MSDSPTTAAEQYIAADVGARTPKSRGVYFFLWGTLLFWSLFQMWIASPLPFILKIGIMNDTQTRAIHLAFAIFLAFLAYPTFKTSPRDTIPIQDWALALIGAFCAAYIWLFYKEIAHRTGAPNTTDLVVAGIGIVLLMEAARRSLGLPLMLVAIFFLGYIFFGSSDVLPDVVRWKGASFEKAMSHLWLTTEGVFGVALGVSSGFVFLFVLFGALLNQAGAGNYFVQIAFSLLGHLCGGPAKAAVVSSAMTGLISGSSIANVVTTGTFTIPLMKKVGFSPEKAGAIEVSSSVNGVLTPPVMGAVAFLMTEYVGIPYVDVVKHAIVPAAISYIALVYIVHLEAKKSGMKPLQRSEPLPPWKIRLLRGGLAWASIFIIAGIAYYLIQLLKYFLGDAAALSIAILAFLAYVALLWLSARAPDIEPPGDRLPIFRNVVYTGLYYIMPIVVLVWFLIVEWKSPAFSAFGAIVFLTVVLLTQKPLKIIFRRMQSAHTAAKTAQNQAPLQNNWRPAAREGLTDLCDGMVAGARNMIGLAAAMGVAGIIVGAVTLTGIGQVMAEFVEFLSGGNLLAMLFFVAVISIVLGMGLPTTANYIVVSSLMAGVVVELGAQSGLIVPLVAVHMFCFYYGIMADVTPPVGLASFAAAAISGGDPVKTGFTAFFYSLRTALLPFLFIFNTDLLLIDASFSKSFLIFAVALTAMLVFAAATMGWFLTRSRLWESGVLLMVAFLLFRPGFFLDSVIPPYERLPATAIFEVATNAPPDSNLRVNLSGETAGGKLKNAFYLLPLGDAGAGEQRLQNAAGLLLRVEESADNVAEATTPDEIITPNTATKVFVDIVEFGGAAAKAGIDFDWQVVAVEVPTERPPKEIFYFPALLLLALAVLSQRRRIRANPPDDSENSEARPDKSADASH